MLKKPSTVSGMVRYECDTAFNRHSNCQLEVLTIMKCTCTICMWVRIPPRAVFSLKKEKAVLGVYICLALFIMYACNV